MIKIYKKEDCCGCYACKNICPQNCIEMKCDNEGFEYPNINNEKCINCGMCEKICPILNLDNIEKKNIKAYACKNKNNKEVEKSSSGGVFILLCKEVIKRNGVVFGATYDAEFNVVHDYSENIDECNKFMGAKYVQSKIGNTFRQVKKFLECDRTVLFSGTPCQISGLESFLQKKYEKLILVDIVCHGVPSPLVYRKYINNLSKLNNSRIKSINFRDKSSGWDNYNFKVVFEEKIFKQKGSNNLYMKGFLSDIYLRPSCYTCEFKKPKSVANITLGDYWGVKTKHPQFYDKKGVSLILINDKKGKDMIECIRAEIEIMESDYEYAIKCNPSIVKCVNVNAQRNNFFEGLNEKNMEERIKKLTYIPITSKTKIIIKKILKKIIK